MKQNEKRKTQQKEYDKKRRKRDVKEAWLEEFSWAQKDDELNLYCKVCRKFPSLADTKSSLFTGISTNFKKETLKFHDKSLKHRKCVDHQKVLDNPTTSSLAKSVKKVDEKNYEVYEKMMNTAYFVASEGEPFTKYPRLCALQEKNGLNMGTNYLNRQACKVFITSIGEVLRNETIQFIRNARFISILSDGSTDRSILEQEIVYVRYTGEDGKVQTRLADMVDLTYGHVQGVSEGIFKALEMVELPCPLLARKLIGINTDGASVNMGKKAGAIKLIKDRIDEELDQSCEQYMTVVHCIAHNLELAVCDSKKGCPYLDKFEETLKGIFRFYYYSPKKRRELYDIAASLDKELKHYGGVQQVRWVASQNRALRALLENYEVTCIHLGEIGTKSIDDAAKARGYLQQLKTKRFLCFLHFMLDWTNLLRNVSELFQDKKALISEVSKRINELQANFTRMKTRRGKNLRDFLKDSENGEFKGIEITNDVGGRRGQEDTIDRINSDIDSLLNDAVFFLEERFIKHIGGEPHSLFNIFDFHCWPDKASESFKTYGDEEIEKLVQHFTPVLTEEEQENAVDQWLDLKLFVARNMDRTLIEAYESVLNPNNATDHIRRILPLINIMLTLSPTTAECERGFSLMNGLKTQNRTSMKQDSLSSLMRIKVGGHEFEALALLIV